MRKITFRTSSPTTDLWRKSSILVRRPRLVARWKWLDSFKTRRVPAIHKIMRISGTHLATLSQGRCSSRYRGTSTTSSCPRAQLRWYPLTNLWPFCQQTHFIQTWSGWWAVALAHAWPAWSELQHTKSGTTELIAEGIPGSFTWSSNPFLQFISEGQDAIICRPICSSISSTPTDVPRLDRLNRQMVALHFQLLKECHQFCHYSYWSIFLNAKVTQSVRQPTAQPAPDHQNYLINVWFWIIYLLQFVSIIIC